jgi:tetratricopeptide (TPR) repeat protein/CHAT domain-containing protein
MVIAVLAFGAPQQTLREAASANQALHNSSPLPELRLGHPINQDLKGGEAHSYQVDLQAGQFMQVVVEQKGIDVVVVLGDPGGKPIIKMDSTNGSWGLERVSLIAETAGAYHVEIRSDNGQAQLGHYKATIVELRPTVPQDEDRIAAERILTDADRHNELPPARIARYERALALYRSAGDSARLASLLDYIGQAYSAEGENQKAIEYYSQALSLMRAMGDRDGEAETLNSIAAVYYALGDKDKALDYNNQALPLMRVVGDLVGEARTLSDIGVVYESLGQRRKALEYYNQVLPLQRAVGDTDGESATLNNTGAVYAGLGDTQKAMDYYNQALSLRRALGNRAGEAVTLTNIGALCANTGERQKALDYFDQALTLERELGNKPMEAATTSDIGELFHRLGERQKALEYFELALSMVRITGDRDQEAVTLSNMASVYADLGDYRKALEYFNRALPLRRAVRDRSGEASTLIGMGKVYAGLQEKEKALDYLNQALAVARTVGDRAGEAGALSNAGAVYDALGERHKALDAYNQAVRLQRAAGDRAGEASTLTGMGKAHVGLGDLRKALDFYNQALSLERVLRDRIWEAVIINSIGLVYAHLGETQKALDCYTQALLLYRPDDDREERATTFINLGSLYGKLGEKRKALSYLTQALSLETVAGNRAAEAATLNAIGLQYDDLGEKQRAIDYYNRALTVARSVGDRDREADTLHNIGAIYQGWGELQKALDYDNQTLALRRAIGNRAGEATDLNSLAAVYETLGQREKALDHYKQALQLEYLVGDRDLESTTLDNIGTVYDGLRNRQKALEYYNRALGLKIAVGDRVGEASILTNFCAVYNGLNERQKALDFCNRALSLFRTVEDQEGQAVTLGLKARVEHDGEDFSAARADSESALEIVEALRASVASRGPRVAYFSTAQDYYELYIDILMHLEGQHPHAGMDMLALEASERRRARGLLEALAEAHADIRQGVDPNLLQQERDLQELINAQSQARLRLLSVSHPSEQAVAAFTKRVDTLLDQYEGVERQIHASSPGYAGLTQPQPLGAKQIQQLLDPDTLLLEYSLGNDRSYLWALTSDSLTSYTLPNRRNIEYLAALVYDLLTLPGRKEEGDAEAQRLKRLEVVDHAYPPAAAKLSRMILGPVSSQLGRKRLLIVADGALQYVPFAALPVPVAAHDGKNAAASFAGNEGSGRPLIADHEIVDLPSASVLAELSQGPPARGKPARLVAILADPVFDADDARVMKAIGGGPATAGAAKKQGGGNDEQKEAEPLSASLEKDQLTRSATEVGLAKGRKFYFPRLVFTRQEANFIIRQVPAGQGMEALDFKASRETVTGPEMADYRIVHLATHGLVDSQHPELSGLVFSLVDEGGQAKNGFLDLEDIFNLQLRAELVVLSACETALGRDVKGEGLEALTRGFMYAGARNVVASLWQVDDVATADLMQTFYKGMLKEGLRPAAAMQQAQIAMWKQKRYAEPYFWAGFVMQGSWN